MTDDELRKLGHTETSLTVCPCCGDVLIIKCYPSATSYGHNKHEAERK